METYEFGKHVPYEEVLKNKEKYVEIFSEEDITMKDFLMFCIDNNIKTSICCAGHDESEPMYVKFTIADNNPRDINNIINIAYNIPNIILEFTKRDNEPNVSLWVKTYRPDAFDDFYATFKENLVKSNSALEISPSIKEICNLLENFNYPLYDLTFSIINIEGDRRCTICLDYNEIKDGKTTKKHFVYYKNTEYVDFSGMKANDEINQAIDKEEANVFSKKKTMF